jgi:hypothetical protein
MRYLLLLSLAASVIGAVVAGCGDDPGASTLSYFYPPDAAYDGVDLDALLGGE